MLFNSYSFIFFYLPLVFSGFFVLGKKSSKYAAAWLTMASLFFYGWWNVRCLFLLLFSIMVNFQFGRWLAAKELQNKKGVLVASITVNLLVLSIFKYANFFIEASNTLGTNFSYLNIILPLGISFFTFTQIAYLVDVSKGISYETNFVHYMLFVTWFPHLIAGPVLHHQQMMPQFAKKSTYVPNTTAIAIGLTYFTLGLFKKVVIADQFALYANPIFDAVAAGSSPMFFEAWIGAFTFTLQLYFDFSGYSDMAIGLSKLFNIDLPLNFNSPYKAASIIEFWRRWHMTLSQFLRDYLYIPLGGNKKGTIRRYINLLLTMLLGGLWHGAGLKFLLWGGLHGVYLMINHIWRFLRGSPEKSKNIYTHGISIVLTFIVVVIAWVPFRASNFTSSVNMLYGMFGFNGVSLPPYLSRIISKMPYLTNSFVFTGLTSGTIVHGFDAISWILVGLLMIWFLPNTQQLFCLYSPFVKERNTTMLRWEAKNYQAIVLGCMLTYVILNLTKESAFLYFQF